MQGAESRERGEREPTRRGSENLGWDDTGRDAPIGLVIHPLDVRAGALVLISPPPHVPDEAGEFISFMTSAASGHAGQMSALQIMYGYGIGGEHDRPATISPVGPAPITITSNVSGILIGAHA